MAVDFVEHCYAGQTVRVYARDLSDIDTGPVITGATVVIERYNPDGSLGESGSVSNTGDDWYTNFLMPDLPGTHVVKLSASSGGKTWKGKGFVIVRSF
jgi:hypothetical protein